MENKEYLQAHLQECFQTIDTCLAAIYNGESHMYRSLAGQLRILLSDKFRRKENSLLIRLHPDVRIKKLQPVEWKKGGVSGVITADSPDSTNRYGLMPYEIIQYSNGLAVADFLYSQDNESLTITEWMDQFLTYTPTQVTVRQIVKGVADQGGGAHVDSKPSMSLTFLYKKAPSGNTFAELFIIALARLIQNIAEDIIGYKGCKVSDELLNKEHHKYRSILAAHVELADHYKEMKPYNH